MKVLRSTSVIEIHLWLDEMPELGMHTDAHLREGNMEQIVVAPSQAMVRIVRDAFEEITFSRFDREAFVVFRASEQMPDWVHEFLEKVLPDDVGFAFDSSADGQGV